MQALTNLKTAKSQQKGLQTLKAQAGVVTRTQKDVTILQREVMQIERDLAVTGSTQTIDDLQAEMDRVSAEM